MAATKRAHELQRFRDSLMQDLRDNGQSVHVLKQGDHEQIYAMKQQLRRQARALGLRVHITQSYPDIETTRLTVTQA